LSAEYRYILRNMTLEDFRPDVCGFRQLRPSDGGLTAAFSAAGPLCLRRGCLTGTAGAVRGVRGLVSGRSATEEKTMKLSARNQLKGKVIEITKGATTSHVRIEIGQGVTITSSITNEAVADLGLQKATRLGR
jgi:molybdopterin-binding protein